MSTANARLTTTDQSAVIGEYSRKVLQYAEITERTVKKAKEPGFTAAGWNELAALVDVQKFKRTGNDRKKCGWDAYTKNLLTPWATTTDYWTRFRRIGEVGNIVFLEIEEHNTPRGGTEGVVNSLSVYEFNDTGKIVHLDIYLQHD